MSKNVTLCNGSTSKPRMAEVVVILCQVTQETSEMADSVMTRLYGQRQALETSNTQLGEMRNMTNDARIALKDMEHKAFMQKICLYSTIAVLSVLIILVSYREITNHGKLF